MVPLIAGRFARGPGPEQPHNVGVGLGLGRRSLSGYWMSFVLDEFLRAAIGST
jgi:hypothetical protein